MPERPKPQQKAFTMQFQLAEGAMVTVTGIDGTSDRTIPRANMVDIESRYPQEPPVQPHLIGNVIQTYKEFGDDHSDSIGARQRLTESVESAIRRGFSKEQYFELLEKAFAEAKRNIEGPTLGSEHTNIQDLREILETEGLEKWESQKEEKAS